MLKKLAIAVSLSAVTLTAGAQSIKTPQPSPGQTIKQDFGISSIELTYSRPGMKGRKIFGDLVPYGKVWRTGANSVTRIRFGDDVTIGGQPLKAGEYAVFSIPGENEWEVIINKGTAAWGTDYDATLDLFHIKVKPAKLDKPVETFTMQFTNIKPASAELQIMWEQTTVSVSIATDIDSKVMTQIANAINRDSRPYFQAAMYYLETNKDLTQALLWFDKALEQSPDAYWVYHQKANALAKMGRRDEARRIAQRSMDLAREQKNEDYVRLNEKLLISLQ